MTPALHHTASIIQFEGELYVPRVLRSIDQTHGASATASIRHVQIYPIEGIEEVSPELNPHSLGHWEVLLDAQIDIRKAGATDGTLSRAVSELLRPCC